MSSNISSEQFYDSLKNDFQRNCVDGKNFSDYCSVRIRSLSRDSLFKCLARNHIFQENCDAENYSFKLENFIYFKQSCIIDQNYKNEVRKIINILQNIGCFIVKNYSPEEFVKLPSNVTSRGSIKHQSNLKKKIENIFFGIKSDLMVNQTRREIDFYQTLAYFENNPEKKKKFEKIYNDLSVLLKIAQEKHKEEFSESFEKCPKCRSYKSSYSEVQTRSADEPMTLFFTCHDCNYRWRK